MSASIYSAFIITLSDRASIGVYDDISGKVLEDILQKFFTENNQVITMQRIVIEDDAEKLKQLLLSQIALQTNFIITTGGTGIGPRDITPDVVKPLLSKEIPGIMELIRVKYGVQFPSAALSRSIAGAANKTLIYCLPGSPKAVKEYMEEIIKTLLHCYKMLNGSDEHNNK